MNSGGKEGPLKTPLSDEGSVESPLITNGDSTLCFYLLTTGKNTFLLPGIGVGVPPDGGGVTVLFAVGVLLGVGGVTVLAGVATTPKTGRCKVNVPITVVG